MDFDLEQRLRNEARHLRSRGVLTWDAGLRAAGLDPEAWSGSTQQRDMVGVVARAAAAFASRSFDADKNTISVVWSTGAAVMRSDYGGSYSEILDMSPKAIRLGRLNAGAALLNTHRQDDLAMVIGSVVPGSARVASGKGVATVLLSRATASADIVRDIADGVIRNISVGYIRHSVEWTEDKTGGVTCRVTDWEPVEISAVAVPADAGAQIQ